MILHFRNPILPILILTFSFPKIEARDPRGTPLDELLKKQSLQRCKTPVDNAEIDAARAGWSRCIDSFLFRDNGNLDEFEELRQYYFHFCKDPEGFKGCWVNVTNLLNSCEPGRGNIARKMYFAIYDLTCKEKGTKTAETIIKSIKTGNGILCDLNYETKKCNETRAEWYAKDICRRYKAQKICEESAISTCTNPVHKEMLENNLEEIGRSLNCLKTRDKGETPASSGTGRKTKTVEFLWIIVTLSLITLMHWIR